jgi:hypothetical protein
MYKVKTKERFMRIKGAMTILTNRAAWYGKTVEWLVDAIDNGFDEKQSVLEAYEVYKLDQGYVWCGLNGVGFTTRENHAKVQREFA